MTQTQIQARKDGLLKYSAGLFSNLIICADGVEFSHNFVHQGRKVSIPTKLSNQDCRTNPVYRLVWEYVNR